MSGSCSSRSASARIVRSGAARSAASARARTAGSLVGQERAHGVEGRPPPALREGPQDVEDRLGIAGVEGLGQHRRGRSIHGRRGRALHVEPVLVQAVRDRDHVAAAQDQRQADPDGAGDGAAGGEAAQAETEARDRDHADREAFRRHAEEQAADAVADAADEHVDGALDAGLHVRRQRQVEQLERRLVDREAQALVEGVGQHHGEEERRRQRQHRPEQERHRQQEDRDPHAEPAQRRPGGGELDDERRDAHAEVEGAEQPRQAIGVAGVVLAGDQAELEPGPLGDDGDEEHHQRQGGQVARPADDAEGGRQPQRRRAACAAATPSARTRRG